MEKDILKYKRHLEKTFQYIANNDIINEDCSYLCGNAKSILSKLKSSRDDVNVLFKIDPPWFIPLYNDRNFRRYNASLLLTGYFNIKIPKIKYSFTTTILSHPFHEAPDSNSPLGPVYSCCDYAHPFKDRILRRFHSDLDDGVLKICEPKSHLHYGGYISPEEYNTFLNLHYCFDMSIAVPRFPNPPIDFILLFDLLLRQFNTIIRKRFIEDKNWINLVQKSEKYRLKQYYTSIINYFEIKSNRTLFETMCLNEFKI